MTNRYRTRLTMSTALAALILPMAAQGALGQSGGFAIEVSPSSDFYTPTRVGARVFGPTAEPASSFVRGCQGHVLAEAAGAAFEVTEYFDTLSFTGAGDGLVSLVLGTPDGLYRCALADDQGFVAANLAGAQPGRYMVWLGGAEGTEINARLFASQNPLSAIELFGLDISRLGEPRAGRFVYAASAETGRQELAMGASLHADSELRPLSPEGCWGHGRLDAADAVLTLDQATGRFSIFAIGERDLVMAVIDPAGNVYCNDDSWQLNPAVTIDDAQAGDYHIWVGGYSQGGSGTYDLFASAGAPAFSNAVVDLNAMPRQGYAYFDVNAAGQGQLLANATVTGSDPMELLPIGDYCAGHTDVSAPDVVLTLDGSQPMMSVYATSGGDLTLAVRSPDGSWSCNDDANGLNPAVSLTNAQPGDYMIWVGTYGPGSWTDYALYASMGSPNWDGAGTGGAPAPQPASLNASAPAAVGHVPFGPATRIDPRVIFDVPASQAEAFGLGDGCAGFITPERPDLVIDAEAGLPQLMIYMVSDADGTLLVQGPDGQIHCNDDFEMLNPGVMIQNPAAGPYAVFAGTYGGTGGVATLGVTIASPLWVMDREN